MAGSLRVAVVRFPGSNCDLDALRALRNVRGVSPDLVWHEDSEVSKYDAVVLPGGFSFGDSLRAGAIAARSPALRRVSRLAERGLPVLGICNNEGNVVGLMPHPERAAERILSPFGSEDGRLVFESLLRSD